MKDLLIGAALGPVPILFSGAALLFLSLLAGTALTVRHRHWTR